MSKLGYAGYPTAFIMAYSAMAGWALGLMPLAGAATLVGAATVILCLAGEQFMLAAAAGASLMTTVGVVLLM